MILRGREGEKREVDMEVEWGGERDGERTRIGRRYDGKGGVILKEKGRREA